MIAAKLEQLRAPVDSTFEEMTFPVYRHLLRLEPAPRHPEQGDQAMVRPLAVAAFHEGAPAGLALAELPTPIRSVMIMKYHESFSTQEIADALDISPSRVRARLAEAYAKLRDRLRSFEDTEHGL